MTHRQTDAGTDAHFLLWPNHGLWKLSGYKKLPLPLLPHFQSLLLSTIENVLNFKNIFSQCSKEEGLCFGKIGLFVIGLFEIFWPSILQTIYKIRLFLHKVGVENGTILIESGSS